MHNVVPCVQCVPFRTLTSAVLSWLLVYLGPTAADCGCTKSCSGCCATFLDLFRCGMCSKNKETLEDITKRLAKETDARRAVYEQAHGKPDFPATH